MKILGLGLSMVDQKEWMKKTGKAGKKFLSKHFSLSEIEYCDQKRNPSTHYSVRWACKEAFLQALGVEENNSRFMKMIEVLADSKGIPCASYTPIHGAMFSAISTGVTPRGTSAAGVPPLFRAKAPASAICICGSFALCRPAF